MSPVRVRLPAPTFLIPPQQVRFWRICRVLNTCSSIENRSATILSLYRRRAIRECRGTWRWEGTTASRRVDRLRHFFSFCVESGWMQRNLAKGLRAPLVRQVPTEPFTDEEMTLILAACDEIVTHGPYGQSNGGGSGRSSWFFAIRDFESRMPPGSTPRR